jgi:hypothetical protein
MSTARCDDDVYKYGTLVGIFDLTSDNAESYCESLTATTGNKHDWYRAAGRAVIKVLLPENIPQPVVPVDPSVPTKEQIKDFGFVSDYIYNLAEHRGFQRGIEHGIKLTSISGRALVYSGHFAIGLAVGGIAAIIIGVIALKQTGLL